MRDQNKRERKRHARDYIRRRQGGMWPDQVLGEVRGVERVGDENRKRERRDSRSVVMGVRAIESREEKEKGGENKRDEPGQRKRQRFDGAVNERENREWEWWVFNMGVNEEREREGLGIFCGQLE
jgi:hypothetical protein